MKISTVLKILFVFHVSLFFCSADSGIWCLEPREGEIVLGEDGEESTSLIKEKCYVIKSRHVNTTLWKKGLRVRDNCLTIPRLTAIATFSGPSQSPFLENYKNEHAAIFVRCDRDNNGIVVYDQWPGRRVRRRLIEYGDRFRFPMHDANMYNTIRL